MTVRVDELNSLGMGIDFYELKSVLKKITDSLDHTCLNELPFFSETNPTAENIARFIFDEAKKRLPRDVKPYELRLCETDNNCVTYRE